MSTKITIVTGSHSVTIEHDSASLAEVQRRARKLWRQTRDPHNDTKASSVGFGLPTPNGGAFP